METREAELCSSKKRVISEWSQFSFQNPGTGLGSEARDGCCSLFPCRSAGAVLANRS